MDILDILRCEPQLQNDLATGHANNRMQTLSISVVREGTLDYILYLYETDDLIFSKF